MPWPTGLGLREAQGWAQLGRMAQRTALPLRVLRASLRAAGRASSNVVDRVMQMGVSGQAAGTVERQRGVDPRERVVVRFDSREVPAAYGASLLEAALLADIDLRSYCGGNCSCGTCRVIVKSGAKNLSKREGMEEFALGPDAIARGDRLACQAVVLGPVEVEVPEWF